MYQDAKSLAKDKDPQLERAVIELLEQLKGHQKQSIVPPNYPTPALQH